MKVKVTKCSSKDYWYYDLVGSVLVVIDEDSTDYVVEPDENLILKKDCEIIEETPEQKPWYETGELPPVGEVCEMMSPILGMWAEQWLEVEIIAIKNDFAIGWCKDKHIAIWNCSSGIRPLKSQEEIEKEKQVEMIGAWLTKDISGFFSAFENLSVNEFVEYLYDSGLRFKEDSK